MAKYLVVFALAVASASAASVLTSIGRGITKEIITIKQPILETVVTIGFSQCENIKTLFGLNYKQIDNSSREPDLDQLSLKYVTKDLNVSLNINAVARLLPKTPAFNEEQLVIYVHGFTDDPNQGSFAAISRGFIDRGQYSVLALDGSSLINWLYLRATTYVRFIGEKLGSILADLVKAGLPASHIHIIGHSLGAHISGFTGKQFTNLTGQKVGRISGLDPAGPCFAQLDISLKLNATDGAFIDVIHTNGGVAGLKEAVGQVDYYPNEGFQQPACLLDTCSHSRAWQYFAESLHDETSYPAVHCASWDAFKKGQCNQTTSYMGLASQPGTVGNYYLQTASESPFGLGLKGITYQNNEGIIKTLLG